MIIAAHQPHYIPWLGYIDKCSKVDLFVVMDDLQYEAQNYQNRQRVKLSTGPSWLTVPLQRGSQADRILEKNIDNSGNPKQHWQRLHWLTIENNYRRSPSFERYADELYEVYTRSWTHLIDLDLHMLNLAFNWFNLDVPIIRSSSLGLQGEKTDRIIDLCRKTQATTYISGKGGSMRYLDVEKMKVAGIDVFWQDFHHPVYTQRYPEQGFVPNLGCIDFLFNGKWEGSVIV